MADKKDVISYGEYQKLSEEEKQNYEPNWNSDGKSGTATRKGAKLPEVKSTIPVVEMKQSDISSSSATDARTKAALEDKEQGRDYKTAKAPSQAQLDLRNGKFDAKDTNGNYTYSFDQLVKLRDEYRAKGDEV